MKALIFSDIHGDIRALERLLETEADYYFAAGDMATWARGFDIFGKVLQKRADRMYVLPGNHESESDIATLCANYGLHTFHGEVLEAGGFKIAGLGYSNPTPFNTPGEYSEEELAARLKPFADLSPLILVCHCPPKQTPLDRVREGFHCGSQSIRDFIEAHQPEWFFCGHIHEAEGTITKIGGTMAVNVGKRGYLLDFATIKA
jgi:Icc-related predicted phosphoesterase